MPPKLAFYVWLLVPVALLAYHFGPGQSRLLQDEISKHIAAAAKAEQKEDWPAAMQSYAAALAVIPASDTEFRGQVRLAHAKVQMYSGEIIEAIGDMKGLLAELSADERHAKVRDEVRDTLGAAEYYAAWLMRLEGAPAAEWTPSVENSRQHYRLLSEDLLKVGAPSAPQYQQNLEAAIRLERMDLSELRGLPLPKFCSSCKNVSQKCRSQCESLSKRPSEQLKDARKEAGAGERPRGGS